MADTSLATVLTAVRALYGLEGPDRQREANEFLIEFARTDAAWRIGLQLLCDASLDATTETLFFAANMIHAKARKEWMRVADGDKASMVSMLQSLLAAPRPQLQSTPVQTKLSGLLAVAMCSSPDECRALIQNLVDNAAAMDASQLAFFLTFARCVCEELDDAELSFAAKDAMEMHVASLCDDVVRVLASVLLSSASTAVQGEALQCLRVWMKRAGLSLTRLHRDHRNLLLALVASLGQRAVHMDRSADILCQVFHVNEYPAASLQDEALLATTAGLLSLRAAYASAVVEEEEEIAHCITNVVTTFGERYVDWIVDAEAPAEAVALGDWLLTLASHPKRQIAALTLDFWLEIQEIPVVERHAFFQRDAYVRLLDVLVLQCTYPGETAEVDEFLVDDLLAFRATAADALLAIFSLLQHDCLSLLLAHVAARGASWPSVEVALFSVSTVAPELKRRLAVEPVALATRRVLELLFTSHDHALVVTSGARLLGQLAAWFLALRSLDTVLAALRYLDLALRVPESRSTAARSVMQVLTACAPCLADVPPSAVVLVGVVPHVHDRQLAIDDRLLLVEGVTRLAATSQFAHEIVGAVLDEALAQLASSASLRDDVAAAVASEQLQLCGRLVRFLDAPCAAAGGAALTLAAVERLWPALPPIAARFGAVESVVEALFQLYGWGLQSLREHDAVAQLLPPVAAQIAAAFESQRCVAPLECAAVAVDVAGRRPACVPLFRELLAAVAASALRHFQRQGVDASPDVLRGLFDLAYRCLLYCPDAMIHPNDSPLLGLLALARASVGRAHRHATAAVVTFTVFLLQESRGRLLGFQAAIDGAVWADTAALDQWIDATLRALLETSPSVLLDAVARLLQALWVPAFDQFGQAVAGLTSQRLAGLTASVLSDAERQRVVELWCLYAASPSKFHDRKFRSLCGDVAKICRKELTPDALLGYDD